MGKSHLITNFCVGAAALNAAMLVRVSQVPYLSGARRWMDGVEKALPGEGWTKSAVLVLGLAVFTASALLPDVDSPGSLLGRHVPFHGEHRTITHAVWFPIILVLLARQWSGWMYPVAGGYVCHLLFDSVSAGGVCWLWPFTRYRKYPGGAKVAAGHKLRLYRTGQRSESVFVGLVVFLTMCQLLATVLWIII